MGERVQAVQLRTSFCKIGRQSSNLDVLIFTSAPRRFQRPSERVPFSDEEGFTFSEAPFEGVLHEGLKGTSPSKGLKEA